MIINFFMFNLNCFSLKAYFPFKLASIIKNGNLSFGAAGERVDSAILAEYMLVYLPAASRTAPSTSV